MDSRRGFLGQLFAMSAGVSGVACAATNGHATTAPATALGEPREAWVERTSRAKHRAVFDSPAIDGGTALNHAFIYTDGYRRTLGAREDEIAAVIVVRHAAMSMVLNSALWKQYGIGASLKLNDAATGKPVEHNPYEFMSEEAVRANEGIEAGITNLQRHGATVLACDLALSAASRQIAKRLGRDATEIGAEVRAGLVAGVIIAPSGIYAVTRAQEAGCALVKST